MAIGSFVFEKLWSAHISADICVIHSGANCMPSRNYNGEVFLMKKSSLVLTVAAVFLLVGFYRAVSRQASQREFQEGNGIERSAPSSAPEVTVIFDRDEIVSTYSGIRAETPFDSLVRVAESEAWPLETKQYDLGIFVESVAGVSNTQDRAWIYFVNSIAGEVAADRYRLSDGDSVAWRYIKPMY